MARPTHSWMIPKAILGIIFAGIIPASLVSADPFDEDLLIGKSLADLLQAGETVISREQDRINDPKLGDKGLDGAVVLQQARGTGPTVTCTLYIAEPLTSAVTRPGPTCRSTTDPLRT